MRGKKAKKEPIFLLGKVVHGSSKRKLAQKPWLCKVVTLGAIPPLLLPLRKQELGGGKLSGSKHA